MKAKVTLIQGDGIGAEVVGATRRIIDAAYPQIEWEECEAGAAVFKKGLQTGVPQETIDSLLRTRLALKGPLETPVGYGEKSANVTLRKLFETFANIRPVRELPGVKTPYSGRKIDLVVVRENVEDLYAGIEHMQTPGAAQCLKFISRKGCEKIVRTGFELARAEGRKKIHCATKANIMKFTEGMLKRTFEEIATEYPDIEAQHIIVDNCAHQLVRFPETFEVIVTTNMNGDILSDLTSGLTGGLGFAPSANLGEDVAIFEAVHGSAPKYAGKNLANPTAVLLSGVMMLRHFGAFEAAATIEHAVLATLEEGKVLTKDIAATGKESSTSAFADEVIKNLGRKAQEWSVRAYKPIRLPSLSKSPSMDRHPKTRAVRGVDVFIESELLPAEIGPKIAALTQSDPAIAMTTIANRGTQVFPLRSTDIDVVDQYRCRFIARNKDHSLTDSEILSLLTTISSQFNWMHVEKLQEFDGALGYSKAQGED